MENIKEEKKEAIEFVPDSGGAGHGAWFSGSFLYWEKTVKRSLTTLLAAKRQADKTLGFISWVIIFAGWFSLGAWLYANHAIWISDPIELLYFWTESDLFVTIFFASLWFDLFMIFKRRQAVEQAKRIDYHRLEMDNAGDSRSRPRLNTAEAFSEEALRILEASYGLAVKLKSRPVKVIHFFRASLKNKTVQSLFVRLDVDAKKMVDMLDRRLNKEMAENAGQEGKGFSDELQEIFILAFVDAVQQRQSSVDILNILKFCYRRDPVLAEIMYELELDEDKIANAIEWFRVNQRLVDRYHEYRRLALFKPGSGMNRSYTAIATPTLDHYSRDLTLQAKSGGLDLCIGRDKELASIFEALSGGHSGVMLVAPTGVGKSTIVGGLAQMMVAENVPPFLKDKRLVELEVSRLVSGADPAVAEERLLECLNEAGRSGNIILYIDNIENMIGISAGSQESLDLSEVLAEALAKGRIMCLASATTDNYARYIENKALGEAMTTIGIKEPSINAAIQILESKVGFLESKYDVYIVYSAIEQAVVMSERYLHDKFLPLKAIDLLEKAVIIAAETGHERPEKPFCSREDVAAAIAELTGIPATKVSAAESQKLLNLEAEIHERLVGQDEAVKAVSASLRRARASLKDNHRPIASFLFLGPTGVGKTELAKAVSQVYFGSEDYMVRLDMSEYQNQDSVRKMIGDVDGTLGYLTEAVRKKPFSLILLDEIEKAHPDIMNLFLQLLDDGRLTDGQGRTISFTESIIIATSNIGAIFIQDQIKANANLNIIKQELIDNQLREHMRPELINRFDGIVVFKPLGEEEIFTIATLLLKKIKKALSEKGIGLKADKEGVKILARAGYDPKFGARPLRRLLQERVEDLIANQILAGNLKRRDQVLIDSQARIVIEKAEEL